MFYSIRKTQYNIFTHVRDLIKTNVYACAYIFFFEYSKLKATP